MDHVEIAQRLKKSQELTKTLEYYQSIQFFIFHLENEGIIYIDVCDKDKKNSAGPMIINHSIKNEFLREPILNLAKAQREDLEQQLLSEHGIDCSK